MQEILFLVYGFEREQYKSLLWIKYGILDTVGPYWE